MNITESMRNKMVAAMRKLNPSTGLPWKQEELGAKIGRSVAAVSRILSGETTRVDDEVFHAIEEALGVELLTVSYTGGGTAARLAALFERAPEVEALFERLEETILVPDWVPTEDMSALGEAVTRLVDKERTKPGKVAREVLRMVSDRSYVARKRVRKSA